MKTIFGDFSVRTLSVPTPRVKLALSFGTLLFLLTTSVSRADLTINGQQTAAGPSIPIGTLNASVTAPNNETGLFTLNAGYRSLMSDANNLQFRMFQVIYYDDEPAVYGGVTLPPIGTAAHKADVVDVPSGGWDYESSAYYTSKGRKGDDTSPFYESDTANNPVTGVPYAFPTLNYTALHSADGVNPGTMSTSDNPGLTNVNHQTLFETFLTYENPMLLAAKDVDLLGGYSWGIQTDASTNITGIAPTYIGYAAINAATLTELQSALNVSGFNAWTVIANDVIIPVPEPGVLGLLALGGLGFLWHLGKQRRLNGKLTISGIIVLVVGLPAP
jgi:hypothetical protein